MKDCMIDHQQQEALKLLFDRPATAPVIGEYQREQDAIRNNYQRLKAARLKREASINSK
jgi:hypothetical protein